MLIANAIFYNGTQPDKVYLGENLVWEKEAVTPPTPTYGSNVFAGKFIDDSMESDWEFWPNGATGASSTKIKDYVDPETKEFNFEYDGTLTSCKYLLNGNGRTGRFERIDHIPDTSRVTNMSMMFANNASLKSVNLSDLDTSNVTDMFFMFNNCSSLISLDLSGFDVSKVENTGSMFNVCSQLKNIKFPESTFAEVTYMYSMFSNCSSLISLDLSGFDVSKVENMGNLFEDCSSLISLDLYGWDLKSKVDWESYIFKNCNSLTTVLGPITGIAYNTNLDWCPLTNASAQVFLNGLAEVTTAKTITFRQVTYDALTPEQIAVATSKGWNVVRS